MKVRYYLVNPVMKSSLILMSVHWNGQRIRISSGMSINPKFWDSVKEKVKTSSSRVIEENRYLESLKEEISKFYFEKKALGNIPKLNEMKSKIQTITSPELKNPNQNQNFINYFQNFIQRTKDGLRTTPEGTPIKLGTYKNYGVVLNHLIDFQKKSNYKLAFDNINNDFYSRFSKYLSGKNISNNAQGGIFRIIKTFMKDSLKLKLHNNSDYAEYLKSPKKDMDIGIVALTFDELERIASLNNLSIKLQNVKDCFLFQCYTGLRYSDLKGLKQENIDLRNETISIRQIKTTKPVIIPIHKRLKKILKKYPDVSLPLYSAQKYNEYIKVLCLKAMINTPVQITKYIGNKRYDETKPKYELISSHTARRTKITLELKFGLLPEIVMQGSGHKNRSSFQRYVRITQTEAVDAIKKVWDSK